MSQTIYVVVGIRESVSQDCIGGPFLPHPTGEVVKAFVKEQDAYDYINNCRLKKPIKKSYGDTSYFKGGYYDMEYDSVTLE